MVTREGHILYPSEQENRQPVLISELEAAGKEVVLGAPPWTPIYGQHSHKLDCLYILGVIYLPPPASKIKAK